MAVESGREAKAVFLELAQHRFQIRSQPGHEQIGLGVAIADWVHRDGLAHLQHRVDGAVEAKGVGQVLLVRLGDDDVVHGGDSTA